MKKPMTDYIILAALTLCILLGYAGLFMILTGCSRSGRSAPANSGAYGVFLGASPSDIEEMASFETVVIDAQYYSDEDICYLKEKGCFVLSYINLGSVEDFRTYYPDYEAITLGDYEHWEGERWVDVSDPSWIAFLTGELAPSIMDKGVDGLFVDNTDVYYLYPTDEIYDGVTSILTGFKTLGAYVCINGGDAYVTRYADANGNLDIIDAVNQETVFSAIDWDDRSFGTADTDDTEYYSHYLEMAASFDRDVYLLEYTTDNKLIGEIRAYCRKHGFIYYVSSTLELTAEGA